MFYKIRIIHAKPLVFVFCLQKLPEPIKNTYRQRAKTSDPPRPPAPPLEKQKPAYMTALLNSEREPVNTGPFTMLCYYEVNPQDTRVNNFGIS